MHRLIWPAVVLFVCCCSSPQQNTETTDNAGGGTTATPEPEGPAPTPETRPEAPAAAAGECTGEPWETTSRAEDTGTPPAGYLACSAASDCVEHNMVGCCGSFAVAVNARFQHCIAERNSIANCRAHCAIPRADDAAPARTLVCLEGSCRMVLDDESPHQVMRLPWDPNG